MKRKISVILASLALTVTSCSDYFELEYPASDLPEWQTVSDMEDMMIDQYESLFSEGGWTYNPIGNMHLHGTALSDIHQAAASAEAVYPQLPRTNMPFSLSGSNTDQWMTKAFKAIRSANTILSFIESIEAGEISTIDYGALSDAEKLTLTRYRGESYFMRGYSYWMMAQEFMPPYAAEQANYYFLPIIDDSYFTASEIYSPTMGTMGEIYDFMISDFTAAKTNLEAVGYSDQYIQESHGGFTNKYAAAAMLMRIYFVQQKWTETIAMCNYVTASSIFDLSERPIRAFNRSNDTPADWQWAKESIFEARFDYTGPLTSNNPSNIVRFTKVANPLAVYTDTDGAQTDKNWLDGGRNNNWYHANNDIVQWNNNSVYYVGWTDSSDPDNMTLNNRAKDDWRCSSDDAESRENGWGDVYYFYKKYNADGDKHTEETVRGVSAQWNTLHGDRYLRSPEAILAYIPIIRLPEVLLTRASAIVQSGGDNATATADVNAVAARSYIPGASLYSSSPYYLSSVTETDIEKERIREFTLECQNDRLRYLSAMKRDVPSNGMWDAVARTYDSTDLAADAASRVEVPSIPYPYWNFYSQMASEESDTSQTAYLAGTEKK